MVQLRAFGMYSYRIAQPDVFFKEVSGVVERYSGNDLETQLRNTVMTQMAAAFGTSNIPFLDMAANQVLLSQAMVEKLQPAFAALGLALESFTVESVTLPENVQQALDKRMSMNIVGDLGTYTQYQTAESIPLAAQNEGGLAGMGAGMGVGVGIGQAMAGAMSNTAAPNVQAASAPAADPNAKLAQLKTMLDNGLITQADYDSAKEQVLKQLLG